MNTWKKQILTEDHKQKMEQTRAEIEKKLKKWREANAFRGTLTGNLGTLHSMNKKS